MVTQKNCCCFLVLQNVVVSSPQIFPTAASTLKCPNPVKLVSFHENGTGWPYRGYTNRSHTCPRRDDATSLHACLQDLSRTIPQHLLVSCKGDFFSSFFLTRHRIYRRGSMFMCSCRDQETVGATAQRVELGSLLQREGGINHPLPLGTNKRVA